MRTRVWIRPGSIEHEEWRKLGFAGLWEGLRGSVVDRNRLRRVERIEGPSGTTWLKRFEGIQWKNAWRLRFSTRPRCFSQAGREEAVIRLLGEGGFRAPEILAWGEEGALLRERRSFLLTRSLEGRPLSDLEARKEEIPAILGVAGHLGATVRAGIFLPDLGLDHVFRAGDGSLSLLDFHNARSLPRPTERELGRALVRFFLSPGGGAWLELGVFGDFAGAYLEAARRPEAWKRVLELARARLDLPGGRDSSGRYEVPGKAEAFARRNPVRDRQERSHLRALIREAGWEGGLGTTLDAACGTGRLRSLLEDMGADWVGLDRSASMLRRARAEIPGGTPLIRGASERLPFADRSVETLVCFRFLHHLKPADQERLVLELARVADRRLILSAFHPLSAHGGRRRLRGLLGWGSGGRHPLSPSRLDLWLGGFERRAYRRQGLFRDLWMGAWERGEGP